MSCVEEVPVAHTPEGGYGDEMPPAILGGCDEPLVADAPDLRGMWRVIDVHVGDEPADPALPVWKHVERIEQAGPRVVVTAGGLIHDMVADGSYERGVNDVTTDFSTQIVVAATFEDGVLVLRPRGLPGVEVRRWRDGEHLMWKYHSMFTARLARI
jgi:hypothetical protein